MDERIRSDLPKRYHAIFSFQRELPGFHHIRNAELSRLNNFFWYYCCTTKNEEGETPLEVLARHWMSGGTVTELIVHFKGEFRAFEQYKEDHTPDYAERRP